MWLGESAAESSSQDGDHLGDLAATDLGVWDDPRPVERSGKAVQLARDPGGLEGVAIRHSLVAQGIELLGRDVCRRQPLEIGGSGRCCVGRDVLSVGTQIVVPTALRRRSVEHRRVLEAQHARGLQTIVELRAPQELEAGPRAIAVTGQQGEGGGQPASCALADHGDAVAVHAEILGRTTHPAEGGVAVLQPGRIGMLRSQPVAD